MATEAMVKARTASGDEPAVALEVLARLQGVEALDVLYFAELRSRTDPRHVDAIERALRQRVPRR